MTGPVDTRHLRQLDAQATPGPWHYGANDTWNVGGEFLAVCCDDAREVPVAFIRKECDGLPEHEAYARADAALIVAARNSLPHLLDRIDTLEAALREIAEPDPRDGTDSYYRKDRAAIARVALRGEGADGA